VLRRHQATLCQWSEAIHNCEIYVVMRCRPPGSATCDTFERHGSTIPPQSIGIDNLISGVK